MKVCIHRGTAEIGGTCVEIEAAGKRIVLDIGLPLDGDLANADVPNVMGLLEPADDLLGVVISHPHQDHFGLASKIRSDIPLLIGEAAARILETARFFIPSWPELVNTIPLRDRAPIQLGPFEITPYLMDHSAYDTYAILVSAEGQSLFYTGDFRAHGRKAGLFEKLLRDPPEDISALLLEGTCVGRSGSTTGFPSEEELVPRFTKTFRDTKGMNRTGFVGGP
jgi:ribonuclease J